MSCGLVVTVSTSSVGVAASVVGSGWSDGPGFVGGAGHRGVVGVLLLGQRIVVDDRVEQRPHVFRAGSLVAVLVHVSRGRHGQEGDPARGDALNRLAQVDEVLGVDVVDVAVVDEHVDDVVELGQREEHFLGDHRAQQRGQEQLLALDAAVVAVGLGGDLAGAHVLQRGVAVDHLAAGVGQHGAELVVLQRGGGAHLDTAERIDHLREPGEIDCHETVYRQARQFLDHLHQALRSTDGIRGVQFVSV